MKNYFGYLKNLFIYCGLDKDKYESIRRKIVKRNMSLLKPAALIVGLLGILYVFVSLFISVGQVWLYGMMGIVSITIFVIATRLSGSDSLWIELLSYLLLICVDAYGICLTFYTTHLDVPSTSFIVFMVLMPLAIVDRPIRLYIIDIFFSITFLIIGYNMKTEYAFTTDCVNVITYAFLGMILYTIVVNTSIKEIYNNERVVRMQDHMIESMANMIEERDEGTGGHIKRTAEYVDRILKKMQGIPEYRGISDRYRESILRAAPLHDIGKINISDTILNKPGRLTAEEFDIMKTHTDHGASIIKGLIVDGEDKDYFDVAYNVVRYHHERYDGMGYPCGWAGDDIPLEARIMAIADVYDALISNRVYKPAFPKDKAIEIIREGRGTQFDPVLTDLFIESMMEEQ